MVCFTRCCLYTSSLGGFKWTLFGKALGEFFHSYSLSSVKDNHESMEFNFRGLPYPKTYLIPQSEASNVPHVFTIGSDTERCSKFNNVSADGCRKDLLLYDIQGEKSNRKACPGENFSTVKNRETEFRNSSPVEETVIITNDPKHLSTVSRQLTNHLKVEKN